MMFKPTTKHHTMQEKKSILQNTHKIMNCNVLKVVIQFHIIADVKDFVLE